MTLKPTCPKCDGSMHEGFVVDQGYGAIHAARWQRGQPRRSLLSGFKMQPDAQATIRAMACDDCGYVENYVASSRAAGNQGRDLWPAARASLIVSILTGALAVGLLISNLVGATSAPTILPILLLVSSIGLMVAGLSMKGRASD